MKLIHLDFDRKECCSKKHFLVKASTKLSPDNDSIGKTKQICTALIFLIVSLIIKIFKSLKYYRESLNPMLFDHLPGISMRRTLS